MNKIIGVFIGLAVGVIMVASLLMPVINDAIDDTKVVYNNADGQYSSIMGEDISIEITNTLDMSVNDVAVDLINAEIPAVVADSFMVKIDTKNNTNYIAYYSEATGSVRHNGVSTITIDVVDNVATITAGTNAPVTLPMSWGYVANTVGDYRAIWVPFDVYLNNLDQMHGSLWVLTTQTFASFVGDSVLYGGKNITASCDLTKVADDIYKLSQATGAADYTFTVDNSGVPYVVEPFSCIVPAEITGTISGGTAGNDLLLAIPLLVIVALIVSAIGLIRFRD